MASNSGVIESKNNNRLRWLVWGTAGFLLLLPAVAMRFTREVAWDETDFIVMGAMLGLACGSYELVTRLSDRRAYRAGFGIAILASFLLVWVNLAVGIIGSEDNAANALYLVVLAIIAGGAVLVRARSAGMAWVLIVAAVAQAVIGVVAVAGSLGGEDPNWPLDTIGATAMFMLLWLASAGLFRLAGRR